MSDCLLSAHHSVFTLLPPSAASAPATGAEDELLFSGSPAGGFSVPDSYTQETRRHERDGVDPLLLSEILSDGVLTNFLLLNLYVLI